MRTGRSTVSIGALFCLVTLFFLMRAGTVWGNPYGQYGGYGNPTKSPSLLVDKFVSVRPVNMSDFSMSQFADNLTVSDSRYHPEDPIIFKIKVKNTSTKPLTNVKLEDIMSNYLKPHGIGISGWDAASRTVRIDVGDLQPDQEKDYIIPMKVVTAAEISDNAGVFCLVNKARVSADTVTDDDTAQFCIEKIATPTVTASPSSSPAPTAAPTAGPSATPTPTKPPANVTVVPQTGPQGGILLAIFEVISLGSGIAIKRKFS